MICRVRSTAGFTIIELMITVAIVGILAAVAIPALGNALARTKQSEARTNLATIYGLEVAHHAEFKTYANLTTLGFVPEGANRYGYCAGDPALAGSCVQSSTDQFDFGSGNGALQGPTGGNSNQGAGGAQPEAGTGGGTAEPPGGGNGPGGPKGGGPSGGDGDGNTHPGPGTAQGDAGPSGGGGINGGNIPPTGGGSAGPSGGIGDNGRSGHGGGHPILGGGPTGGNTGGVIGGMAGGVTGGMAGGVIAGGAAGGHVIGPSGGTGPGTAGHDLGGSGSIAGDASFGGPGAGGAIFGGAAGAGGGLAIGGNPHVSKDDFEADAYGRISSKAAPFDVDKWLIDQTRTPVNYIPGY